MIIICIAHSDGPKNRSQSKFNGKVQTTLHYSEVRAHAVVEAYEAFVQMHKDMNPPNISAHVVPPELVIQEYHSLAKMEGFAEYEQTVLSDATGEDTDMGDDWQVFSLNFIPPGDGGDMDDETLARLKAFFQGRGSPLG